jgi:hypothetical protein
MLLVSPTEDGEIAAQYADNLKQKPGIRATWEQVYLGARGELAFARLLGDNHLQYCREHLLRSDARRLPVRPAGSHRRQDGAAEQP